jgi:DNA (cytosine-5)-methyltransferase 1
MTSNIGVKKLQDFGTGIGFSSNTYSNEEQKKEITRESRKSIKTESQNENQETYQFQGYSHYQKRKIGSTLKAKGAGDSSDLIVETTSKGNGLGIGNEITVLDGTRVNDVRTYQAGIMQTILSRWGTGGNNTPSILIQKAYTKGRRAQSKDDYETLDENRPSPTLNVFDNGGENRATVLVTYAITERAGKPGGGKGILLTKEASPTLNTSNPQRIATKKKTKYIVRRLTPIECERLMGWDDDHTRWDDKGLENSDSARYKMIGNGISAPVAQFIGENILKNLKQKS